jgi:hypothetical protein
MAESEWPEVAMIVLGPAEGSIDHDCMACADGVLDNNLSHAVVVMPTNATVFDPQTLVGSQLRVQFLGGVDVIVGTVGMDGNACSGSLLFKMELGLDGFSPSKSHLVENSKLGAGGIVA